MCRREPRNEMVWFAFSGNIYHSPLLNSLSSHHCASIESLILPHLIGSPSSYIIRRGCMHSAGYCRERLLPHNCMVQHYNCTVFLVVTLNPLPLLICKLSFIIGMYEQFKNISQMQTCYCLRFQHPLVSHGQGGNHCIFCSQANSVVSTSVSSRFMFMQLQELCLPFLGAKYLA